MPLATLKVLGGTFKLNAIACSRACYARACICSRIAAVVVVVVVVVVMDKSTSLSLNFSLIGTP